MNTYRLTRNMLNRVLGGVCGGIGSYLGISGWWVRLAFIALALASFNFTVLLYILFWLVIPGQALDDLPPILQPGEPRTPRYAQPETMLILGAAAIGIGILLLAQSTGALQAAQGDLLAPGMLLLIGLVLLLKQVRGVQD
jgi:phage shock protein C